MELLFGIMALLVVASAVAVVALRNPVYSALALVLNLMTVAGLFAQLEAHFLAAVQVIVYAGAIMVLVIFVLMLLNLKVEAPKPFRLFNVVLSSAAGLAFLVVVLPRFDEAFKVFAVSPTIPQGTVKAVGEVLYTRHVFLFEAASVLIMAALVGAVMLAKRRYRDLLPPVVEVPGVSKASAPSPVQISPMQIN